MKYKLTFAAAALIAAACPGVAAAADTKFVLTGGYKASWVIPETVDFQTPSDQGFGIADIEGAFPGSTSNKAYIDFYSAANGGGLMISDNDTNAILAILEQGAQLYTGTYNGPTGSPIWKTGSFAFTGDNGQTSYTLSISPVTAAPEPATWAMMVLGMGVVGAALRRSRRTRVAVRFA